MFGRLAHLLLFTSLILTTAAGDARAADADTVAVPDRCVVSVALTGIASLRATDRPPSGSDGLARGDYHLRVRGAAEIGPFSLRQGEASSFAPGITLEWIDAGRIAGDVAGPVHVRFDLMAREEDSATVGAGDEDFDDLSLPLPVHEFVVCPGGRANLTRFVEIPHDHTTGKRRKPDRLRVSIQLKAQRG